MTSINIVQDRCKAFEVQLESLQSEVLWRYGSLPKFLASGPPVADLTAGIARSAVVRLGGMANTQQPQSSNKTATWVVFLEAFHVLLQRWMPLKLQWLLLLVLNKVLTKL